MNLKTYNIRITTIDNLYADYIVEATNLFFAKIRAREAFYRDYPSADSNMKFSLNNPNSENITEIMQVIKEMR